VCYDSNGHDLTRAHRAWYSGAHLRPRGHDRPKTPRAPHASWRSIPLIHLATAFRDHLGQSLPSDTDFRQSIALLLKDAGTEFVLARDIHGTALGYVQLRYRHSMWTSAPEAELEAVFVVGEARRRGGGATACRVRDRACPRQRLSVDWPQHKRAQRRRAGVVPAVQLCRRARAVGRRPPAVAPEDA
jgi:hypothetical protein